MPTEPTDPITAVATIRRAATAMRKVANGAYPGPWTSDENNDCWRLHSAPDPKFPTAQILKAPKHDTPYAEYWPDKLTGEHIVAWHPGIALLVADALDALADDIVRTTEDGELHGPPPAEWTAAYNLAVAFLAAGPNGGES